MNNNSFIHTARILSDRYILLFNLISKPSSKPLRLSVFFSYALMMSSHFSVSLFLLLVSLCDLVKTFQLARLACPDFLTCILSLWKNYAPLTSVSYVVSEFLPFLQYHFSPLSLPFFLMKVHSLILIQHPQIPKAHYWLFKKNISSELGGNLEIWGHFNKIR